MEPVKLYLAGPMTGIPQFNYPLFERTANELRKEGWSIVSPAEMDDPETRKAAMESKDGHPGSGSANGETWGDFLARDVKIVADEVDGIIFLPGWMGSRGARLEAFVAITAGKEYFYQYDNNKSLLAASRDWVKEMIREYM